MMKLSVLLLPALLALSSASLQDIVKKSSEIKKDLGNSNPQIPTSGSLMAPLAPAEVENGLGQFSSVMFGGSNLYWQTFSGSVPNGAISIYNSGRTDYVCKYECSSGFYTPSKGPYCYYPNNGQENRNTRFQVLVNRNNYESMQWKPGSYGSVPRNSVATCDRTYVGRNEYGLGKVYVPHEAFYLPRDGKEYRYNTYHVLTFE